ncbi:RDD family protein [Ideonella sp. BN130291]|uniref:RDD family protein n=1 Tax=Ideonella sp. BN130291 TaxID=3112940 RepID=UPI002E255EF8|nr:RDD family protein [Ideonella sp. BN130291]
MSARLDTLVTAETPEGIELTLRPAGCCARSLAYVADLGVRLIVMLAAGMTLGRVAGVGGATMLLLYFLLEWFYPVAFELSPWGATPGKRLLNLRVVMDSGLPVTPAASLVRNLLRAADFLPALYGFGLVCLLLRRDFKRLGDLAAGTLVVHAEQVVLHAALPPGPASAPRRSLSLQEQSAVLAWAGRSGRITAARAEELAALAGPILPAARQGADATERLLSVAHWLLGRRPPGGA